MKARSTNPQADSSCINQHHGSTHQSSYYLIDRAACLSRWRVDVGFDMRSGNRGLLVLGACMWFGVLLSRGRQLPLQIMIRCSFRGVNDSRSRNPFAMGRPLELLSSTPFVRITTTLSTDLVRGVLMASRRPFA